MSDISGGSFLTHTGSWVSSHLSRKEPWRQGERLPGPPWPWLAEEQGGGSASISALPLHCSEGAEFVGSGSFRLTGESTQMRPSTAKAAGPCGDPGSQGATRTQGCTYLPGLRTLLLITHSPRNLGMRV